MIPVGILTAAANSTGNLLLDLYPGAIAAYSLRKLRTAYTGPAVRVQRSSDGAQQDIGFNVLNNFDSVTLATFCGAGSGSVVTWYDQSGNANNATQTIFSLMPEIYFLGVPVTANLKPALQYRLFGYLKASLATGAGNGIRYISSYNVYSNSPNLNLVGYIANEQGTDEGILTGGTLSGITGYGIARATNSLYSNNETIGIALKLGSVTINTVDNVFVNGTLAATGTTGGVISFMNLMGGTSNTAQQTNAGAYSEFIFYNSDQSANRTGIESNINSFYTIY
jgi:hypothetical protein